MYNIKNLVKRGSALLGAAGLVAGVGASALPAFVSADALNPLYERSLTLSSASPGWSYSDGSNNVFNTPPANSTYAAPNTGANGKQTGETFSFRVSSAYPSGGLKAMSFQYCIAAAGDCTAPGNNGHGGPVTDAAGTGTITLNTSDATVAGSGTHFTTELQVGDTITVNSNDYTVASIQSDTALTLTATPGAADSGSFTYSRDATRNADSTTTSDFNFTPDATWTEGDYSAIQATADKIPAPGTAATPGQYVVLTSADGTNYTQTTTGWSMAVSNLESGAGNTIANDKKTGKNNYVVLTNSGGATLTAGDYVKVVFYATDGGYITNPGSDAFYAKINTYSDTAATHLVDGGVTVANVMNESINIQTKVLETMNFSVGTVDPDTLTTSQINAATGTGGHVHGACDPLLTAFTDGDPHNVLRMGDIGAENSLDVNHTYATHSYFRLSSNSDNGATVYYTGVTLSNTEGSQIAPIFANAPGDGLKAAPSAGTEQFGLALDNDTTADHYYVNYATGAAGGPGTVNPESGADTDNSINGLDGAPSNGSGTVDVSSGSPTVTGTSTSFDTELGTGDVITVGSNSYTIASVDDPTHLTLTANATDDATDASFTYSGVGTWGAYVATHPGAHNPQLYPLAAESNYDSGLGGINTWDGSGTGVTTQFAFDPLSNTVPTALASENTSVVDCVTGKVRYIANISGTTPAGIYTTKINFVAAPQY